MDHIVRNERLKLLANALDRTSTACFTVGGIVPLATVVFANGTIALPFGYFAVAATCWILFGIGLHLLAQEALRGLR
ncbi:MAG: hypothetical protein HY834_11320 [Devosia nanyangense]|uniref:Uncharacterized protein n=1 Tax=Devosia nanyangense TaxID=1228055 RepID=A0A933L4L7_9HYPH|nr:hypothetical protein [Devosia nanyangense]